METIEKTESQKIHYSPRYEHRIIKQKYKDGREHYDAQYRAKGSDAKWLGMNYGPHDLKASIEAVHYHMINDYDSHPLEVIEIEFEINGESKKIHQSVKYEYRIMDHKYHNSYKQRNRCFAQFRLKNSTEDWGRIGKEWTYTVEECIELIKKGIESDIENTPEIEEIDFAVRTI